jgi:hypothetical protein
MYHVENWLYSLDGGSAHLETSTYTGQTDKVIRSHTSIPRLGFESPCSNGPLPPGRFLVLISIRGLFDFRAIVRLEGLDQLKNPMTSSGIEPATFWLVAECLNRLRQRMPPL